MSWLTRERVLRGLTFVSGLVSAYFLAKDGQHEAAMTAAFGAGTAVLWPQDRERGRLTGEMASKLESLPPSTDPVVEASVEALVRRAKRVSLPPPTNGSVR